MSNSSIPGDVGGPRESREPEHPPKPGLVVYGFVLCLTGVIVIAVFVALGGPLRNMFSNAVGEQAMGQNQAALSAGIYGDAPTAVTVASTADAPTLVTSRVAEEAMERSAQLTVEVENVHATFEKTYNLILERKGRVLASRVSQASGDEAVQARIAAKVPPGDLNAIVAAIQASGVIVTQDLQNTDHTDEIADIAGRIEDRRAAADQLRRRMADTALTAKEFESVRGELERIRAEIDAMAGTRAQLASRTELARIEIQLVTADPHASLAFLDDFTRSLTRSSGLAVTLAGKGISLILIALGALLPWMLLCWTGWRLIGKRISEFLARTRAPQGEPAYAKARESIS